MPALAIAEAYDTLAPDVQVRLYAAPGGPATRLAEAARRPLTYVTASALARAGLPARIGALLRVIRAVPAARAHLEADGARLVIGTGGYASGPVLLAARSLGLATAIVEPNAFPGLANRWLRRWVDRAYVGSNEVARQLAPAHGVVTGTPVMAAVAERLRVEREAPRRGAPVHVLVTGASVVREVTGEWTFDTYDEASAFVKNAARDDLRIVSKSLLATCVPLEAVEGYRQVFRSLDREGGSGPHAVQIFEYAPRLPAADPQATDRDPATQRETSTMTLGS